MMYDDNLQYNCMNESCMYERIDGLKPGVRCLNIHKNFKKKKGRNKLRQLCLFQAKN